MPRSRKNKLSLKSENLNRQPRNSLHAQCLAWKRQSRAEAERTTGASLLRDFALFGQGEGPSGEFEGPIEDDREEGEQLIDHFTPHNAGPAINNLGQNINLGFEAGRRQREEEQWKDKHPSMFPVFLLCKHKTKDWADPMLATKDWLELCDCNVEP